MCTESPGVAWPAWLDYYVFSLLLPSILLVTITSLLLAAFGWNLGVRRIYTQVLLDIFEYARHVAVKESLDGRRRNFLSHFSVDELEIQSDSEDEDGDTSLSLVNGDNAEWSASALSRSIPKGQGGLGSEAYDEDPTSEPYTENDGSGFRIPRMISRHNVISRRDNLILQPDTQLPPPETLEIEELILENIHNETDDDHRENPDNNVEELDIEREPAKRKSSHEMLCEKVLGAKVKSVNTFQREFSLEDVLDYVKTGVACIIEDEVTQRFEAEELKSWNLMTRTNENFRFINWKLSLMWGVGFFWRYCVLFPGRLAILLVGLVYLALGMSLVGMLQPGAFKRQLHHWVTTSCFQVLGGAVSLVATYHDLENRPRGGSICVANHTTPIDVLPLACDCSYAFTGQRHGGFLGWLQAQFSKASPQVWFDRTEARDRLLVFNRLKEHVEDAEKCPILIFPEGTCINNTSVMQFKKGSFEVGGTIYPVAIKYDPKFGDAFWNSSKLSMVPYIITMMTSWAIVCDIWYLPPMKRREGEDAIEFANRVKRQIALKGGLVDLVWDGNLKRQQVKKEWKAAQQEQFSRRLKVD